MARKSAIVSEAFNWIEPIGKLVLFNSSVTKNDLIEWAAKNALGPIVLLDPPFHLIVAPKVREFAGFPVSVSQVNMAAKFGALFVEEKDIVHLKLAFNW